VCVCMYVYTYSLSLSQHILTAKHERDMIGRERIQVVQHLMHTYVCMHVCMHMYVCMYASSMHTRTII